jgi:hypothetical protein
MTVVPDRAGGKILEDEPALYLRPKRLREKPPGKIYIRLAKCRELLAEFCGSRRILVEDITGLDRDQFLVEARREFCNIAKAAGIGPIITGKVIHRSHWTVQFHTNAAMRERKLAYSVKRRRAAADRNGNVRA